jgi:hypothetical protein
MIRDKIDNLGGAKAFPEMKLIARFENMLKLNA